MNNQIRKQAITVNIPINKRSPGLVEIGKKPFLLSPPGREPSFIPTIVIKPNMALKNSALGTVQYIQEKSIFLHPPHGKAFCQIISYEINYYLSLIHISEPTRLGMISYAVFC